MLEEFQAAAKMPIQTRLRSILLSVRYFGSIFCCSYVSVGVVLGDTTVSSWATLRCRPGRHCSVVVGDIAPELCTGRSRQIRPLWLNTHPCCEGQVTFPIRVEQPFAQSAARHLKIAQSHKSCNNAPKFQLFPGSPPPEFPLA